MSRYPRQVPWCSWEEWDNVKQCLFSSSNTKKVIKMLS